MLEEDFYRTYSKYLRDIYGEKVYKLPVKLNLSCPNRDGNIATGGCIFCGEEGGSFENCHISMSVKDQVLRNKEYISKKYNVPHNTIDFVFHGGSGSTVEEIREAISYGVVKMNIDTDLQYAFTEGIRDYMKNKADYLQGQIGNPEGPDAPNKKYYDPRVWLREGEKTFIKRLK